MAKLNLYKFHWNCGGMGDLDGVFFATQKEISEIIGKHGEVFGKVKAKDGEG